MWARRLALSVLYPPEQQQHPWLLAAQLFNRLCHPGFHLLALLTSTCCQGWGCARVLPPALQRGVTALGHLPLVEDIGEDGTPRHGTAVDRRWAPAAGRLARAHAACVCIWVYGCMGKVLAMGFSAGRQP